MAASAPTMEATAPPRTEHAEAYLLRSKAGAGVEEVLQFCAGVWAWHADDTLMTAGSLMLTEYRLVFCYWAGGGSSGDDGSVATTAASDAAAVRLLSVPLANIHKISVSSSRGAVAESARGAAPESVSSVILAITAKDCHLLKILTKDEHSASSGAQLTLLSDALSSKLAALADARPFAELFNETFDNEGWDLFEPHTEFGRIGALSPKSKWRQATLKQYSFAPTYPSFFMVPDSVNDSLLCEVAKFRSKSRIPILSWLHPKSGASIVRCAQPLCGAANARSSYDELYFQLLACTTGSSPDQQFRVLIADARPWKNAVANRGRGGGYEVTSHYCAGHGVAGEYSARLQFMNIENIHEMRASLKKMHELYRGRAKDTASTIVPDAAWLTRVEATCWLEHVHLVLTGAADIVRACDSDGECVVVHCSDGWDRTAQLVALALLCLDPYYRTLKGFGVLVEKEWLAPGHKFKDRTWGARLHERSPVFHQFLDCVHQLMAQFPGAFEFNDWFLLTLGDHVHSNLFGTFLHDNERDRMTHCVRLKTVSLWSYINDARYVGRFKHALYTPQRYRDRALSPSSSMASVCVWNAYFERWVTDPLQGRSAQPCSAEFDSPRAIRRPHTAVFRGGGGAREALHETLMQCTLQKLRSLESRLQASVMPAAPSPGSTTEASPPTRHSTTTGIAALGSSATATLRPRMQSLMQTQRDRMATRRALETVEAERARHDMLEQELRKVRVSIEAQMRNTQGIMTRGVMDSHTTSVDENTVEASRMTESGVATMLQEFRSKSAAELGVDAEHKGWLWKDGERGGFKKRWFVFAGDAEARDRVLVYFESPTSYTPKGIILLSKNFFSLETAVGKMHKKFPHRFELLVNPLVADANHGVRCKYTLAAESEVEMRDIKIVLLRHAGLIKGDGGVAEQEDERRVMVPKRPDGLGRGLGVKFQLFDDQKVRITEVCDKSVKNLFVNDLIKELAGVPITGAEGLKLAFAAAKRELARPETAAIEFIVVREVGVRVES